MCGQHSDWRTIPREVSDNTFRMRASQWPRNALAHGEISEEVEVCRCYDGSRANDGQPGSFGLRPGSVSINVATFYKHQPPVCRYAIHSSLGLPEESLVLPPTIWLRGVCSPACTEFLLTRTVIPHSRQRSAVP